MQLQIFATRRPFGSELDMMKRLPRWITMREGSGNSYIRHKFAPSHYLNQWWLIVICALIGTHDSEILIEVQTFLI